MAGLAAVSTPLIKLLLTDKWLPAVFFLHIACITQALQPINTANIQLIKALGRSDYFLKMEAIKKFTGIVTLLIGKARTFEYIGKERIFEYAYDSDAQMADYYAAIDMAMLPVDTITNELPKKFRRWTTLRWKVHRCQLDMDSSLW